jgi:hypothetical protein
MPIYTAPPDETKRKKQRKMARKQWKKKKMGLTGFPSGLLPWGR